MHEKQKIIIIVKEAVRISKKFKFRGIRFSTRIENLKQSEIPHELNLKINEKIELFKNMPENCESYKCILNKARKSLVELKQFDYNFSSIELINDFLSIESIFKNDLQFVGIREYEKIIKKKEEIKIPIKVTDNGKITYLKPGIKYNQLRKEKENSIYVQQLLENINI